MAARKLKRSELLGDASAWELLVRLAAGGMGAVYLGVRRGTSAPIYAIKRAHSHLLDEPAFRKMFSAEAQLALRIRHPNAIGVKFVDETDGELLLVMDYFEGCSLGELLGAAQERNRRIPPAVVLRIVVDAARGLHAAHSLRDESGRLLGIVHRDVSPQNILVGITGTSAIVDFGVAKAVSVDVTRTATHVLKGKTAYLSPEYIKNRTANVQTDVFSMGIVVWECLANRRLFKGEDELETMQRVLALEPAPKLHEVTSIDRSIGDIVAFALEKDPSLRATSVEVFARALERAAANTDLLATHGEVAATVKSLMGETLNERQALVHEAIEGRQGPVEMSESRKVTVPLAANAAPSPGDSQPSHSSSWGSLPVHKWVKTQEMSAATLALDCDMPTLEVPTKRKGSASPTERMPSASPADAQPTQGTFSLPDGMSDEASRRPSASRFGLWATLVLAAVALVASGGWLATRGTPSGSEESDHAGKAEQSENEVEAPAVEASSAEARPSDPSPSMTTSSPVGGAAASQAPVNASAAPAPSQGSVPVSANPPTGVPTFGAAPPPKASATGWRPKSNPYGN